MLYDGSKEEYGSRLFNGYVKQNAIKLKYIIIDIFRGWHNTSVYISIIRKLVVRPSFVLLALTIFAICMSQTCSRQCHRLVHKRPWYVLSCVCDNA